MNILLNTEQTGHCTFQARCCIKNLQCTLFTHYKNGLIQHLIVFTDLQFFLRTLHVLKVYFISQPLHMSIRLENKFKFNDFRQIKQFSSCFYCFSVGLTCKKSHYSSF